MTNIYWRHVRTFWRSSWTPVSVRRICNTAPHTCNSSPVTHALNHYSSFRNHDHNHGGGVEKVESCRSSGPLLGLIIDPRLHSLVTPLQTNSHSGAQIGHACSRLLFKHQHLPFPKDRRPKTTVNIGVQCRREWAHHIKGRTHTLSTYLHAHSPQRFLVSPAGFQT